MTGNMLFKILKVEEVDDRHVALRSGAAGTVAHLAVETLAAPPMA